MYFYKLLIFAYIFKLSLSFYITTINIYNKNILHNYLMTSKSINENYNETNILKHNITNKSDAALIPKRDIPRNKLIWEHRHY